MDDELVAAFERLIPQLSSSSPPPSREHLEAMIANADTVVFVARVDGSILGSLTLAFYRIPTGLKAWIEDVVVDTEARGRGVGELLNRAALDEARRRGAKDVEPDQSAVPRGGQPVVPPDRLRGTRDERVSLHALIDHASDHGTNTTLSSPDVIASAASSKLTVRVTSRPGSSCCRTTRSSTLGAVERAWTRPTS